MFYWRKTILFHLLTCFLSLFPPQGRTWFYYLECDTQDFVRRTLENHTLVSRRGIVQFYHHFWQHQTWQTELKIPHYMSWIRNRSQIKYTSTPPPPSQHGAVMKSIHVGQLGLFFVCNRMFMKMIHDRHSSSYANLRDTTGKPLISATSDKEGFFWSVTIRIYRACLDFIPWCKCCFPCNHAKAQLASISLRL